MLQHLPSSYKNYVLPLTSYLSVYQNAFSNNASHPAYITPIANTQADMVNPIDRNVGSKPSPTYSTYYTPNASPMNQMMPISPSTIWSNRHKTLPPILPYILPYLAPLSSQKGEDDTQFVDIKKRTTRMRSQRRQESGNFMLIRHPRK